MADMYKTTGADLIELGLKPGPHFGKLLDIINDGEYSNEEILEMAKTYEPAPKLSLLDVPAPCVYNITANNDFEIENLQGVTEAMDILRRVPIVVEAAIMPDACPAGTIPVGGVVATRNAIVPGFHSADICCSLQATIYDDVDPKELLDAVHKVTHFGPGGRQRDDEFEVDPELLEKMAANDYLSNGRIKHLTRTHMGTQGDGNHFAAVCILESTGQTVLITHHGSRGVGANLFKAGKRDAEKFLKKLSPKTPKGAAWIPSKSKEGIQYWEALQLVREWTRLNHCAIHDAAAELIDAKVSHRFWNEHNFVFKEMDGDDEIFWHAKGATPIHTPFLPDGTGTQIVPLNMVEPILIIQSERNERNRGFAPHGAGRNMSRTKHIKLLGDHDPVEVHARETKGIDARFFSGHIDPSELPSAYKNAQGVQDDMEKFDLARVVDRALPYGCIMAGEQPDLPWKNKKKI